MSPRRLAPFALAALLCPAPAAADPIFANLGDAVTVAAETLEIDVAAGQALLLGNVALTRGELRVACPRIELKLDGGSRVTWARGSGGVTADIRGVHAEGPEVELDLQKHTLELRGGVRLSRGTGWLQAEKASIDTSTAKVTLTQVKGSIPVPPRGP